MARALIVGCGCRGRALGTELLAEGWQVRGTSRTSAGCRLVEEAGIEPAPADPDRVGTILDHVGDVAVVVWALGSATGALELVEAINGPRLGRVLEKLVDTPVRGFVYERVGTAGATVLEAGTTIVAAASSTWRIPTAFIDHEPNDHAGWVAAGLAAVDEVIRGG